MTEATAEFLDRLKQRQGPRKTVWCTHGKWGQFDEHQVCIDVGGAFEKQQPGRKWSCPCSCHK